MKKNNLLLIIIALIAIIIAVIKIYTQNKQDAEFNCRGRVYVHDTQNFAPCIRNSAFDVFFTMNGTGKGYIIISGTSTCSENTTMFFKNEIINFTYIKEDEFYSLNLGKRDKELVRFAKELRDDNLKIKIINLNSYDHIITSPIDTIMMCTTEKS